MKYKLKIEGGIATIEARDAEDARRKAAYKLSYDLQQSEGDLVGPTGQTWTLFYDFDQNGMAGWRYSDANGDIFEVYPGLRPRAGSLGASYDWHGLYLMDNGEILMADDSEQFESEDFFLLGAVYYSIYDETGEVDGGWFGYDERTMWRDFQDFVASANQGKVGRRVMSGDDDDFFEVISMLDDGTPFEEIEAEYGLRLRELKKKSNRRAPAKGKPASRSVSAKPKTKAPAKKKAPAKTTKGVRR